MQYESNNGRAGIGTIIMIYFSVQDIYACGIPLNVVFLSSKNPNPSPINFMTGLWFGLYITSADDRT